MNVKKEEYEKEKANEKLNKKTNWGQKSRG